MAVFQKIMQFCKNINIYPTQMKSHLSPQHRMTLHKKGFG